MRKIPRTLRLAAIVFVSLTLLSLAGGASADNGGWIQFTSAQDGFSAQFPQQPTKGTESSDPAHPSSSYSVSLNNDTVAYQVWVITAADEVLQKETPQQILEAVRDGAVKNVKGTLRSWRWVSIEKDPGIEFVVDSDPYRATVRTYLVGKHLYMTQAIMPQDKMAPGDVAKFLNSFALVHG